MMLFRMVLVTFMILTLPGMQLRDPDSDSEEDRPESPPSPDIAPTIRHNTVAAARAVYPATPDVARLPSPVPDPIIPTGKPK